MTAFFERITEAPRVYDAARGDDALQSLTEALAGTPDLAPAAKLLGAAPKLRALLAATFSCSPYLTSLALRDPATLAECVLRDPDAHLAEARAELAAAVAEAPSAKEAMALLAALQAPHGALDRTRRSRRRLADRDDAGGHERDRRRGVCKRRPRFCFARRATPGRSRAKPTRRRRPDTSSSPWASSARSS